MIQKYEHCLQMVFLDQSAYARLDLVTQILAFSLTQGFETNALKGSNEENIKTFSQNFKKCYHEHHYDPTLVWNVDESGAQVGYYKVVRVLARTRVCVIH